jgi:hypothetical protein
MRWNSFFNFAARRFFETTSPSYFSGRFPNFSQRQITFQTARDCGQVQAGGRRKAGERFRAADTLSFGWRSKCSAFSLFYGGQIYSKKRASAHEDRSVS